MGKDEDINKIYGRIIDTFMRHEDNITKTIYPNEESLHGELTPTLLRGYGGPSSTLFKLINQSKGKSLSFMVRHYSETPETYKGKVHPWEATSMGYNFLHRAGVDNIPRVYMPNGSRILFMEWIEGKTLIDDISGLSLEGQVEALNRVLKPLAQFQYKATAQSASLDEEASERLFVGRKMEEKAREYFSKITGKPDKDALIAYRLIERAHEGFCVNHGDLGHTNVLIRTGGKVYFIDHELAKGDGYNDLGSLLAYLGMYIDLHNHWVGLGERFWKAKSRAKVEESGGEVKDTGAFVLTPEGKKEMMYKVYASLFHKSFKILAKNQKTKLYPQECEERLRKQIQDVLSEWLIKGDDFGLGGDDRAAAGILFNTFKSPNLNSNYTGTVPRTLETVCG